MTIPLVLPLPAGSSDLPGGSDGPPSSAPLFGLAPGGVYQAPVVTNGTVSSYLTISPLPRAWRGGIFSVALSFLSPRLGVTQHPVLRSPDFPLLCFEGKAAVICPTPTYAYYYTPQIEILLVIL